MKRLVTVFWFIILLYISTVVYADEAVNIQVISNKVNVSGAAAAGSFVCAKLSDGSSDIDAILGMKQVKADLQGSFSFEIVLDPKTYKSGEYLLTIWSGEENAMRYQVMLYDADFLNMAVQDFNEAADFNSFAAAVKEYGAAYGILNEDETFISLLYEVFCAEKEENFKDYKELTRGLEQAVKDTNAAESMLDGLNKASEEKKWSQIAEILRAPENSFVGIDRDKLLSNKNEKEIFLNMTGKTYASLSDVKDSFETAYKNALEDSSIGGGGSSSNGSGSGGGGTNSAVSISNNIYRPILPEPIDQQAAESRKFNDLEGYYWAENAINRLQGLNVVNGNGTGNFEPGRAITREEFLKMLFMALNINTTEGDSGFTDVDPNEWYCPVIKTAGDMNVINGYPDGRFGVGVPITRADMAIMSVRLLTKLGAEITPQRESVVFADFTQIPEYARSAVDTLYRANIINGVGDNLFSPLSALTRAEAAVLVYNILEAEVV